MCSNKDNINSFLFFIISSFMRKIHKNCNDHIHKLIYEYNSSQRLVRDFKSVSNVNSRLMCKLP